MYRPDGTWMAKRHRKPQRPISEGLSKHRKNRFPPDWDPPEVLALYHEYLARRKAEGKELTPALCGAMKATARRVYLHPELNCTVKMIRQRCAAMGGRIGGKIRAAQPSFKAMQQKGLAMANRKLRLMREKKLQERELALNPQALPRRSQGRYLPL